MPYKSEKQRRLFQMVMAGKSDRVPVAVAREYEAEERRRKAQTTDKTNTGK